MLTNRETFQGVIQWPHLDFGNLGVEKQFVGLDIVADAPEGVEVAIGYDQSDPGVLTDPYMIDADTLTGQLVPFPVAGPSFSVQLTFAAEQTWEWSACVIYIQDMRGAR